MEAETSINGPFDLDQVRELIEMMEKYDLTEVCLRRGDEKWRLRRGTKDALQVAAPVAAPLSITPEPPQEPQSDGSVEITSPTVGTFYASPTPDDAPFVQVGTTVDPDTVVCIIEAMKVFNQIPAETSGTITKVLVNNGDPVEFGQPLYRVRPG